VQIFEGQIRFGIHSGPQNTTFASYLQMWQKVEELGFDWASVFDHFIPMQPADPAGPCFEGLTLLSAMAAHTTRLRCGILVVGNTYRNPAVLANIGATIDHVSGGRLELGIGAGWYEMEHNEYGIPFYTVGRRIRMLGETAKIVKGLWTQERTTFRGRYYNITDASCEPKPVQSPSIPLWVGGAGEQLTLRVVAESADGWNTFFLPLDAYQRKLDALASHCRDFGRDPADIRKSLVLGAVIGETEAEVQDLVQRSGGNLAALRAGGVAGTPEQCAEQLLDYVRAGVGDFILRARPPANERQLELFIKKVAPIVRAEAAALPSHA
jgi:F420-dependent oxidoreductase-like protein